jgi:UDP-N-acetylmuramoyl-tripeptide--D-alanyl-D-alanine ligase
MNALFDIYYQLGKLCTDSRSVEDGSLFVCIKGDNFDGNTFAEDVLSKGASHVVIDNPLYHTDPKRMTLVASSVGFIQELANHHRKKFNIPVIGITGSNGKTTTKELIHAVLSKKFKTLATEGNLNNHLGVPYTLLRLDRTHEIAVIEMGANKPGDIDELCQIAEPTHGIITNIGKAHLEGFGNFEGVLKTKTELFRFVEKNSGLIVFNGDDQVLVNSLSENTRNISYGTKKEHSVVGELVELTPFVKMKWKTSKYTSPAFETHLVGEYNFYNFLAAAVFGNLFEVPNELISSALSEYEPTNKRSQVKHTKLNTLILDCYNANPSSMELALRSFANNIFPLPKLAIIGGMKELGAESDSEHKRILDLVSALQLECISVGSEFSNSPFQHYESTEELFQFLASNPIKERLILLKGSRSVGLERLENVL